MRQRAVRCLLDDRLREAGMSRAELADKIDMDRRQISRYATNDIQVMTFPIAVTIAKAIGLDDASKLYVWEPVKPRRRRRKDEGSNER